MISYNDILPGRRIILEGQPYEVLSSQINKKSRQKAANQTRLKNLTSGKVVDRSFHQSDSVEEAAISKKEITYLFSKHLTSGEGEHWFCEKGNPHARFSLSSQTIGKSTQFLTQNTDVEALYLDENVIGIQPPIKTVLKVTEAPPSIRGNTSQGGTKQVTLETGATVTTPLFINEGGSVRVNTQTGEYVERVEKKSD